MTETTPAERLSREEMSKFQMDALRKLLARAEAKSPFYGARFREMGISPNDIRSLEDLSLLPLTEKSDLVGNYPYGLCTVLPTEIIRVHSSSGTTGKPINTYYNKKDQAHWQECMSRNLSIAGVTAKDVCQIAFRYTLFTGAFGHHLGAEGCGAMVIPTSSGQTERQIMMMQDLKTTVIHCTPSYAIVLIEKLKEMGIAPGSLSLRLGIHGAESMSEEMRTNIEEGLGVTAIRDYGLTELGGPGVSIECPHKNGFHINEDHFFPEIIDPETLQPLPPDHVGELVFTSLQREAMPVIRYRTRDITHLIYDTCECGRTLVRHGPILGRSDDMLIVGGVNFFPSQLESVLLGFAAAAPHYEIHLRSKGAFTTVSADVETRAEFWNGSGEEARNQLKSDVENRVKDLLGFRIEINLKAPHSIPRSEGKTKRVFDER